MTGDPFAGLFFPNRAGEQLDIYPLLQYSKPFWKASVPRQ